MLFLADNTIKASRTKGGFYRMHPFVASILQDLALNCFLCICGFAVNFIFLQFCENRKVSYYSLYFSNLCS